MNPESMAGAVRLGTDGMFRLPTPARPELFDAISSEDTEAATSRRPGSPTPA